MSAEDGAQDTWDFTTQRNETALTVHHLNTQKGMVLGTPITLQIDLVPDPGADAPDQPALLRALGMFGYRADVPPEADTTVQVSLPDLAFEVEAIWTQEERVTKIALSRGFVPDGWGFWEP
ncbi:MAG: hypothetical protein AAFR93_15250 [Pseudomonadota bacterium]